MKKFKKVLAVVTALAMVMAPVTAMADGNLGSVENNDTGYLEGVAPDDVYAVVLPYTEAGTYDFILDPEQLLSKYDANASKYASDATLYFKNTSATTFGNTSDIATAINKGSDAILLDVEASFAVSGASISCVTSGALSGSTPSIALSIVAAQAGKVSASALTASGMLNASGTALSASGASIATSVTGSAIEFGSDNKANATFYIGADKNNFEIKQYAVSESAVNPSGHEYVYEATNSAVWSTVGFAIQGAANTEADWSEIDGTEYTLTLKVVYTLSKLTDGQKAEMIADASGNAVTADAVTGLIEFEGTASEEETETAPSITAGATKVDGQEYDYTATFTKGTALTLTVDGGTEGATVTGATVANTISGSYSASSKVTNTTSSVTLGSDLWSAATSGTEKYAKITLSDSSSFIIKVTIA